MWTTAASLPLCCIYTHTHTLLHHHHHSGSQCYDHIRGSRGDFGTERLFTGPLKKIKIIHRPPPPPLQRAQAPSALRLRRCFLRSQGVADLPATNIKRRRNSTVVAAFCLHVDVHITAMWRLLQSCCFCCCWIFSLVLPAFVLLWADCHPGKFQTPPSQTRGFYFPLLLVSYGMVCLGMWLSLWNIQ